MAFNVVVVSANFNRPADTTAYAANDLVANDTTAGSVVPLSWTAARIAGGSFIVRRARLKKTNTTTTNGQFRLHLYGVSPTPANGDNGAWSTNHSTYLGSIDLDMTGTNVRTFTDVASVIGVPNVGTEIAHQPATGQTVYGLLQVLAAYTPTSAETFTVELEVVQN